MTSKKIKVKIGNECRTIKVCVPRGDTGPTGPTGVTGLTGSTGPIGPTGFLANAFGSFVGQSQGGTGNFNGPVLFTTTTAANNMTITSNDTVNIQTTGTYAITYNSIPHATSDTLNGQFHITINGSTDSNSLAQFQYQAVGESTTTAYTYYRPLSAGDTVQLIGSYVATGFVEFLESSLNLLQIA